MRPNTTSKHSKRRPNRPRSPPKTAHHTAFPSSPSSSPSPSSSLTPSISLLDQELETLQISPSSPSSSNPRIFPHSVKQQCWDKADKVKGRDPDRWRRDALGNIVFRKLVGCPGCLCHDYDHILPYSKGGQSTLENCQVLQSGKSGRILKNRKGWAGLLQEPPPSSRNATVNRSKGNQTDISRADLIRRSSYCRVSGRDMDLLELSAYGNVRHTEDSGGCRIQ